LGEGIIAQLTTTGTVALAPLLHSMDSLVRSNASLIGSLQETSGVLTQSLRGDIFDGHSSFEEEVV